MRRTLRLPPILAFLVIAPTAARADAGVPVLSVGEPASSAAEVAPPVSFSIPKYSLAVRERETVAACLVLEAADQGKVGMHGVMAVIRNRARGRPELFAPTVLRPKQFSALNRLTAGRESLARVLERAKWDPMWSTALEIVDAATRDDWQDPTGSATHYTRTGERTAWTKRLAKTVIIGGHSFYR